jgi:hypothetical protein
MIRDSALTERLRALLAQITALTASGTLHWTKQIHSSHRYAEWNGILLLLGPDVPLEDHKTPRFLHITPLFKPQWTEVSSVDPELHDSLLALIYSVEAATVHQQPIDPFALTDQLLKSLTK